MSGGQIAYLSLVVVAFTSFAVVLFSVYIYANRE